MLSGVDIENFTVFPSAALEFDARLNVFIGENGTGKSHLLKLLYSALAASEETGKANASQAGLDTRLADKLAGVFRPEHLGRLPSRGPGRRWARVRCRFSDAKKDFAFEQMTTKTSKLKLSEKPGKYVDQPPVYLPTRELLTIFPGFTALYDERYLDFEETWRDTCRLLALPALRGPREAKAKELLEPLEAIMGGTIELDATGRFYLVSKGSGRFEMHLVAEGLRKVAMVAKLVATGVLAGDGYLFWDEPEANLNPRLVKEIAQAIIQLSQGGVQLFIATHSLFLMRELDILLEAERGRASARFFGLHFGPEGVEARQGNSIDNIGDIAALDEELQQSDRYLAMEE